MSELANKLIEENKRTKAKTLDLANCGLSAIPAQVGDLLWLETLYLLDKRFDPNSRAWRKSGTRGPENQPLVGLTVLCMLPNLKTLSLKAGEGLSPLAQLSSLQSLYLVDTQVSDITPLAGLSGLQSLDLSFTRVSDIRPLAGLRNLQLLDLIKTQVSDITPLAELSGLQTLYLSDTQVRDITPLAELSGLHSLYLQRTDVSDISPLARLFGLQLLHLTGTQVSDITPLAGLTALQSLHLTKTQVSDIKPLARLSGLRSLDLSRTQVSDVTPLAALSRLQTLDLTRTQVSDIKLLAGLSGLQSLNLSSTQVSDVTPLARLSGLRSLHLGGTQVSDISPLIRLSGLQTLDLSRTQVSDIKPLAGLSGLQSLHFSYTQVSDITPLAGLSGLQSLELSYTQVSEISALLELIRSGVPVKWSSPPFAQSKGIFVNDCPLTIPPPEVVKQGNDAVLGYFAERDQGGVDRLYEAKMLIVGDGGAGKTSLLRRLYQQGEPMPTEGESTKGIAIYQHSFSLKNGRTFRLNVWDFGGQEIYHATHQFFLTHRSLYVLLDDTRKNDKSVQDPGFRNWLDLVEVFGGGSPVLIFQNKKSGRSKAIDLDGIKSRYTNVKDKYEGDLAEQQAADRLREAIEFFATNLGHIGEELPASWIKVRTDLESVAIQKAYISQQDYFAIYKRHLNFDESRALVLSQYLHDLGVFLHFQKDLLLKGIVILQNEWATQAVFRILDDESVKKRLGRFGEEDCARIWRDSAYATKHPELLALMQKFELCYELPDKMPREWLAPQLLPPGKPKELNEWNKQDNLVLRYRYRFLPKGMISRLTVRMHRFVKRPEMAWATGVVFEREATKALVELMTDGEHIEIRAHGPEAMGLLSAVSFDLDALNESFEGLKSKVVRLVPCRCDACANAPIHEFYDQADLVRRVDHGRATVECKRSYQDVDVMELLYQLPGWSRSEGGAGTAVIRIFLASSSDLRDERDAFELYLRQWNDDLRRRGTYLEVVRWENFLDAMSETRLQDEYNKAVRECDVFVALYFAKVGRFTDEEFEAAWGQFKTSGKPKIFTYFKNAATKIGDKRRDDLRSLLDFQDKLEKLGHYQSVYESSEDLKLQFGQQLSRLLDSGGDPKARRRGA